jgi:surface protein
MRKIISGRRNSSGSAGSFVFTIDTSVAGDSGVNFFRVPIASAFPGGGGTMAFTANWGDGTPPTIINASNYTTATLHNYGSASTWTVKLTGLVRGFGFGNMPAGGNDDVKITEVTQWGDYIGTQNRVFEDCTNLSLVSAADAPLLENQSTAFEMFDSCANLIAINNIANWDTSRLTTMQRMFNLCTKFQFGDAPGSTNPDLSAWDVNNVSNFQNMFYAAQAFNGKMFDVTSTATGSSLDYMFFRAYAFNNNGSPDIDNWDVSNTTQLSNVFFGAKDFNQPLNNWNVSSVTRMENLFSGWNNVMTFNQPLSNWDTANVTRMNGMFFDNPAFDQDLRNWNVNAWNNPNSGSYVNITGSGTGNDLTLSTTNYNALLIAWDQYAFPSWPGGTVDFGNSQYSLVSPGGAVVTARNSLIAKWGAISDGGGI